MTVSKPTFYQSEPKKILIYKIKERKGKENNKLLQKKSK
jgi:hypothetical protein